MRPRLELRHLWYFVAVAEELNFSRAAARAGIAQPPLSQQIRHLERILGCTLFDRTGRRVRLTDAGAALLPEARRLLADAEGTATLLRRMGRGEVGALTIGFAPSTLYSPLPAAVRRFREKFPGVRVRLREIVPPEHGEMLRGGSVDVVLVREPETEEGVAAWPILVERFVAALPAGHALAVRPSLPVSALRDEPFVLFPREIAPVLYRQVTELCHAAGFEPKVVQEAHEWHTILSLVEAGLGVALVPDAFQERRAGALAYVALSGPQGRTTTYACARASARSPTASAFLEVVREVAPVRFRGG
jgi:DNA-binding transcriptional LysR family regulator